MPEWMLCLARRVPPRGVHQPVLRAAGVPRQVLGLERPLPSRSRLDLGHFWTLFRVLDADSEDR
eukprot:4564992-Amphidinium_carterae.1